MSNKKSGAAKKARMHTTHKKVSRKRPIHKRVLLHPMTAFLLLCVGVLVAGSTFKGRAETYDVTAEVPAPAVTSPAVITAPADQSHGTSATITVQGTCPADSYVKLYHSDLFSGTALCTSGQFAIQTMLSLGANTLQARVFNTTDSEGPQSVPITVYYDLPVEIVAPSAPPTTLQLSDVEQTAPEQGVVQEVSANPTISGLAPPFSDVTVTFYSEPSVCKTKADSKGVWTCTLPSSLPPGLHHVVIEATTLTGKKFKLPTFEVRVVDYVRPFTLTSDYKYKSRAEGQSLDWTLAITGGTAPYQLVIDWGDGQTLHLTRADQSEFTISHAYRAADLDGNYVVLIHATDARGATTVLQLAAVVGGVAMVSGGPLGGITEVLKHWLWVVWPAYIAVVLMVLSFWIGERQAYQQFIARRRMGRPHAGRR